MTLIALAVLSEDQRIGINLNKNSDKNAINESIRSDILLQNISRVLAPLVILLMSDI